MLNVKECREKDIERLVKRNASPTAESDARKAMNSFYRLALFNEYLVTIQNDSYFYENERRVAYVENQERRFEKWHKRLNEYFKPFNAVVKFYGIFPTLETVDGYNLTYGYYYK